MIASGSSERGLSEVTIGEVGELGADRAHQRPLRPVAVAAAAEDAEQPALGEPARGAEHVLERIGGVGVVDEDREGLALVHGLEPPGNARGAGERRGRFLEADPERGRRRDRGERVGDVEMPGQRQRDLGLAARSHAAEAGAGSVEGDVRRPVVGVIRARGGEGRRARRLLREAATVGIVDVDDRGARGSPSAGAKRRRLAAK